MYIVQPTKTKARPIILCSLVLHTVVRYLNLNIMHKYFPYTIKCFASDKISAQVSSLLKSETLQSCYSHSPLVFSQLADILSPAPHSQRTNGYYHRHGIYGQRDLPGTNLKIAMAEFSTPSFLHEKINAWHAHGHSLKTRPTFCPVFWTLSIDQSDFLLVLAHTVFPVACTVKVSLS